MIVIHNPAAGPARTALLDEVLAHLARLGASVELRGTERPGHAETLARAAASRGDAPLIVAAGGDGTIAEVVNGLAGTHSRLGIIPTGTANVLAHELGLPRDPAALAAMLCAAHTAPLWPGVLLRAGQPPRHVVQMLGAGFDAHVVHTLPLALKRFLGRYAYAVHTFRALAAYRFPRLCLTIDGATTETHGAIVSKGRHYGGAYLLAPDASATAPGFTVTLLDRPGAVATLRAGLALGRGRLDRLPGIRQLRAREIGFTGPAGVAIQADGDPAGTTPCLLRDAGHPIPVVIPAA